MKNFTLRVASIVTAIIIMAGLLFTAKSCGWLDKPAEKEVIIEQAIDLTPTVQDRVQEYKDLVYENEMEKLYLEIPENIIQDIIVKVGTAKTRVQYAEEYNKNFTHWSALSISKTIGDIKIDPKLKQKLGDIEISTTAFKIDSVITTTPKDSIK